MINLLYKNTCIKIQKSFGRFFSLFVIILVGVGFLAGLQQSAPDITNTMGQYYAAHHLMDFRIVSTLGLTDGDVDAIKAMNNVETVVPSYLLDVSAQGKAIRVEAIQSSVNTVKLVSGRMPASSTECVADRRHYKVGDKVTITGNASGKLKNTVFTVVGTVDSPLYLDTDYGNTTIGDGKLYSFILIDKENFTLDAYTELYIIAAGSESAAGYSQTYADIVSRLNTELAKLKPTRETARYQSIYNTAAQKIADSQNKLDSEKASGEKKLADAKATLDDSAAKLADAKTTLAQNETNLQKNMDTQNAKFQTAKTQIASGRSQIDTALKSYDLTEKTLGAKISEISTAIRFLKQQQSQLPAGSSAYAQLEQQISQLTASYQGLVKLQASIKTLDTQEAQLNQGISTFNTQIAAAQKKLADGKTELAQNEKKLQDGYSAYHQNAATFKQKIADAQAKLDSAKSDLSKIEHAKWTVLNRDSAVTGYSQLKSATDTITSVSKVFPLFFILIVILMTSNTMARMIAEERSELGTLASLGYSNGRIISTYLFYVLSATVLGVVIGFFAGCILLPRLIYLCFPFILPPLVMHFSAAVFCVILAAAALLMASVTVFFCRQELKQQPAALMRPVPPKSGQTILLERAGFLWNHLSFTWKVTMRNIFRYKQRGLMTIVGIAGCTALLLAGFGLKDSINGVAEKQYGEIFTYSDLIVLKNDTQSIRGSLKALFTKEHVQNPTLFKQGTFTYQANGKSLDTYLVVPENETTFSRYFHLKSTGGSAISLSGSGVVISQGIALARSIGAGDKLTIKDADGTSYTFTVTGVADNYMQNYVYMDKSLYRSVFGSAASYNMVAADSTVDEKTLAEHLIDSGLTVNVTFRDDIVQQAVNGNKGLNNIVVLLVCIAALLAVVVLYNLTSINISERIREIATLKVLGFHDHETNEYIYREAFVLTLVSIGIGLVLGIGFHRFLMQAIQSESMVFFKNIHLLSFLWSFLIMLATSILMQVVTYFKLKKVNMIESLKSVE